MMKRLIGIAVAAVLFATAAAQDDFNDEIRKQLDEGITLYKKGVTAEAEGKKEEAIKLYRDAYGKLEPALQKLDKVPPDQRKSSADLVYAFMQRVGNDLVAGMINSADPQMKAIGHRLFEMAKYGEPFREGKDIVLGYVNDLKSDDFAVYRNAHWHLRNYGSWACRFLVGALGNKQEDKFRSRVMVLLNEMGVDASLAVLEALDSKDDFAKQNAAIVLGNIKDERAIPALKRTYENPNEKPEVKKFAHEALQKITRKSATEWKKATDYYYALAEKFYYGAPSTIFLWQPYYLIWKWDVENDRITERRCARFVYNEHLAEEALFDLLELDPNYVNARGESAWALAVMVHFQEALEAESSVMAAVDSLKNDEITRDGLVEVLRGVEGMSQTTIASIGEQIRTAGSVADIQSTVLKYFSFQAKILRSNILANIPGRKHLYEALARSMTDKNFLVATACIEAIKEHGRPADLPPALASADGKNGKATSTGTEQGAIGYPLIEALTSEDKRVRYAAAEAMVKLNPQQRALGMELVIPLLVDALGEQGVRVALVIHDVASDEDRNFVNKLRQTLIGLNLFPVIATSGAEGVVQAKAFPSEDVILIQKKIAGEVYFRETTTKKQETESVLRALSLDVRTRNIPRIVIAANDVELEDAKKEFEQTSSGYIKRATHPLDLKAALDKIFDSPEAKKDSKDRADRISRSAAETLASIDPTNTLYPFSDAVEALIRTVSPTILREDFIRIPAARALGIYGDQRAFDVLAKVVALKDADASKVEQQKPIRLQCARSLSWIYRKTGAAPSKEVYDVLLKSCVEDGDYDIEYACGQALGNAALTLEQRREVLKARRVKRETYTAEDP